MLPMEEHKGEITPDVDMEENRTEETRSKRRK